METHGPEAAEVPRKPEVQAARLAFHLIVCLVPTLPLVADWAAVALGWKIFFFADPRIQLVFATAALAGGIWLYGGYGLGRPFRAGRAAALLVAAASLGLYGFGVYLTFWRPEVRTHPFFQAEACLLTGATAAWWAGALLRR